MSKKPKRPPFSLKLTFEQRAALEVAANGMPLGTFIKKKVFEGLPLDPPKRRRHPVKDQKELARLMVLLGQSRLATNVNQLAKAANSGSLLVSNETDAAIMQACRDIAFVRHLAMRAMGVYESE